MKNTTNYLYFNCALASSLQDKIRGFWIRTPLNLCFLLFSPMVKSNCVTLSYIHYLQCRSACNCVYEMRAVVVILGNVALGTRWGPPQSPHHPVQLFRHTPVPAPAQDTFNFISLGHIMDFLFILFRSAKFISQYFPITIEKKRFSTVL